MHSKARILRVVSALGLCLAFHGAVAAPEDPRLPLKGATVLRVANYGSPSARVVGQELKAIMAELNALAKKPWRKGDTRMTCYSTVTAMEGPRTVGIFRIKEGYLVDRGLDKGEGSYSLGIAEDDLPILRKMLTEITPPKNCT